MSAWRKKKVGSFSKGMQQRVGLAQALMHKPELLLLDEPTDGVDPVGRREIRELLLHLKGEGHTVLVNSHILAELEPLCSQVAILVKGTVAREGSLKDLTAHSHRWELDCSGDTPVWLDAFEGLTAQTIDNGVRLSLPGSDEAAMQLILDRARNDERSVRRLEQRGESLEDLFMRSLDESTEANAATPGATTRKQTK
jgi:ABC-2 type transport system ATP-binding protein